MFVAFQGAWDRIHRAEGHRQTFGEMWNAFCEDQPYNPGVHVEDDGEGEIWVDMEVLPVDLPLVFGELLYQLRAALDSAVYDAAIVCSGKNPPPKHQNLAFPVCRFSRQFEKAAGDLSPLSDGCLGLIESMQPCNAMHYPEHLRLFHESLDLLNDWARKDRHRKLHIISSWASSAEPILELPDGVRCTRLDIAPDGVLERESVIATFSLTGWQPGMEIYANPNVMIDIAADEEPLPRHSEDTLSRRTGDMVKAVRIIVEQLGTRCGFPNAERESEHGRRERPW